MVKEKITEIDEADDFGFTFHNEEEIGQTEVDSLKIRLRMIRKTYLPLLQHLAKDPDKPMIKWPNRKDILEKHIKRMTELTEV